MSDSPQPDLPSENEPSRRRLRRHPIHGVFVAIDAPDVAEHPWVVDAIDINAHGLGLVMPPELEAGTRRTAQLQVRGRARIFPHARRRAAPRGAAAEESASLPGPTGSDSSCWNSWWISTSRFSRNLVIRSG